MQKKITAAIYIRVSTEEQAEEGQSVAAQEETLRQYCNAYGIEIYDIYTDLGLSGKRLKGRTGLSRLMEDCIRKRFNLVLVWKISRLSRNLKDLLYLIELFERNNVHFTSCSEKFDTSTPVGRMTLQLLGSIAEFERNTIVENVKLGLGEFARKGGKASAVLGYDNIGKKLVINDPEARIVKLIYSLYTESGMNPSAIARHLNNMGYRSKRGSMFRSSSISYILHNPVYIGVNRHQMRKENNYSVSGTHTPIIDPGLWNKTQKTAASSKASVRKPVRQMIPAFQVTCMKCNMPMTVFYSYSKGRKYKYYRCCSCSNYVNFEKLMNAVSCALIKAIEDESLQHSSNKGTNTTELDAIDLEINRLKKSSARYFGLFEGYKLSDSKAFVERINEIEKQIKALEDKRMEICAKLKSGDYLEADPDYFTGLKTKLSDMDPEALKHAVTFFVKSIEAYRNEIKVILYL
ncbi:MAG TPA: recombinase family protein [Clostridia bacterium]|nr:recombinase family protein [Clostridia bacterium]